MTVVASAATGESETIARVQEALAQRDAIDSKYNNLLDVSKTVMHELRKLNSQLKAQSEDLTDALAGGPSEQDLLRAAYRAKNVFATSTFISNRLDVFNYGLNPTGVTQQRRRSVGIYKKFEKAAHVISSTVNTSTGPGLNVEGASFAQIDALPLFDLLPYFLIENAFKYSPKSESVVIRFADIEQESRATVRVESVGPMIDPDELGQLWQHGFRGRHAKSSGVDGSGLGLYLAGQICSMHNIEVRVTCSGLRYRMSGVPYAAIAFDLTFNVLAKSP